MSNKEVNVLSSTEEQLDEKEQERVNVNMIPPNSIGNRELDSAFLADYLTETSTNTVTNKSIDGDTNTLTDIPAANLKVASQTTGDVLYASSASVWSRLGIGSTDQVLKVSGGLPSWATQSYTSFQVSEDNGAISANQTLYSKTFVITGIDTTESTKNIAYPTGTLKGFYVASSANTIDGISTITVRKNASDTAIAVTIPASTAGYHSSSGSVAVTGGDILTVKWVMGGSSGSVSVTTIGLLFAVA